MLDEAKARELFFAGCDRLDARDFAGAETALRQALALAPGRASILVNLSTALLNQDKYVECRSISMEAVRADPGNAVARFNLGICLYVAEESDAAMGQVEAALQLDPRYAEALKLRGLLNIRRKRFEQATSDLDAAIAIDPTIPLATGLRLLSRLEVADWRNFDSEFRQIVAAVRRGEDAISPYGFLRLPVAEDLRQQAAVNAARHLGVTPGEGAWRPWVRIRPETRPVLRVGYISGDFRAHALAHLISEMLELHDRDRFRIIAISDSPDDGSAERRRIAGAVDAFHDIAAMESGDAARLIAGLEADILVDLTGFTGFNRPKLLSQRLAPLQVSYLGYAGTMAVDYFDYLVADRTVVPEASRGYYSEAIAWVPDCYQVTDTTRAIPADGGARSGHGLPDGAFVFCCFNQPVKVMPSDFDVWMEILAATPGSVMWLYTPTEGARENYRREAEARGIDSQRLVFAGPMPHLAHLTRLRHADLFLDTLHCGAHTTGSDALWAGLPVLTRAGDSFAGRVSTSLVRAAGLPELAVGDTPQYLRTAVELATDPARLAQLRAKLAANRSSCALFDTARTTRNIERLYEAMHARQLAGQPPAHLSLD